MKAVVDLVLMTIRVVEVQQCCRHWSVESGPAARTEQVWTPGSEYIWGSTLTLSTITTQHSLVDEESYFKKCFEGICQRLEVHQNLSLTFNSPLKWRPLRFLKQNEIKNEIFNKKVNKVFWYFKSWYNFLLLWRRNEMALFYIGLYCVIN